MNIIQNPNPILRKKAQKVEKIDAEIKKIIVKMKKIMRSSPAAVALAAPQIGINKAIVVTGFKPKEKDAEVIPELCLINPRIIKSSAETIKNEEGCLSLMDKEEIRGNVERAKKVLIEATDEKGKIQKIKAEGFFA
ncbi:MAG: peptide deformylase, partial [Candidatus Berkelbacteria bacterium Licking1014_96]